MSWDTEQYLKFAKERERPAADLLAQVEVSNPRLIVDLGCGTGTLARQMAERWPSARVVGVDHSPAMLAKARQLAIPGRLEFVEGDLALWSSAEPVDLIFSNAALHWAGDHERLLARLVTMLAPEGTLAVQMPNNLRAASHETIYALAAEPRFAAKLSGVGLHRESVEPLAWYAEQLLALDLTVNAWETKYVHVLRGENPVLQWLRGTALRPLLAALDKPEAAEFERELAKRLALAYPARGGVTLFTMARIFFVGRNEGRG